ncbi:F-box/kelch-repeat protein At3g23880-like [Nicotiana tabacum]|uniref:F-box/kelch-repeat protein At3g23880-like n=1 Tax=Nicotiana tabacum TaxID=4097 RepID=A0AC58TWP3_TOBAC
MRCVSKSWLPLISSPQFVKTHLKLSAKNQEFSLLYTNSNTKKILHTCSLNTIIYEEESPISIPFELDGFDSKESSYRPLMFLDSCDGLFCVSSNEFRNIFIWNPSTRELKELPLLSRDMRACLSYYGFGYNERQDDYRVVVIAINKEDSNMVNLEIPSATVGGLSGKFVNGRLHWSGNKFIFSLNLVDETYGNVALPNFEEKFEHLHWYLRNLGRNLCAFHRNIVRDERPRLDVWIMKEYGVVESWTKVASVPVGYVLLPIFTVQDNKILVKTGTGLMMYNSTHDSFKYYPIIQVGLTYDQISVYTVVEPRFSLRGVKI